MFACVRRRMHTEAAAGSDWQRRGEGEERATGVDNTADCPCLFSRNRCRWLGICNAGRGGGRNVVQEEQRKPVGKQTRLDVWVTNEPATPRCACLCAPQQTTENSGRRLAGSLPLSSKQSRRESDWWPADGGLKPERTEYAANTANARGARACDSSVTSVTLVWASQ